ncbi:kinesin-like protein KIN-12C [Euphorbia lathyris]|uniref:kinesin-like protein KIN-12C n=1 Tax=Euphorbia lathyris TaxID=212925 RepID=UPI003313EA45
MSRIVARNAHSSNQQEEANENELENSLNSAHFPPPRTPLNTIPDPSQFHRETHESDFNSKEKTERLDAIHAGTARLSGKKIESVDKSGTYATPRVSNRQGKLHLEPNSVQNTPTRSGNRASLGGGMGAYGFGVRAAHFAKGKETTSTYRHSRRNSMEISEFPVEAQHFELDEDPAFWAEHNVQVLIRIRPLSYMERVSQGQGTCVRQESSQSLLWLGHPETRFTFDHVACETISQETLFRVVGLPMVENCMSGYNSCMFAYGQTGSGKTYTMMGEINQQEDIFGEDCGITPRTFEYLFSRIRQEEESRRNEKLRFSCKCSFVEIYNEQITDLLEPSSTNLQLREDLRKGVYVENLTESNVKTVNDVIKLLSQGAANRKIAATNMNSESSRSHSVFTCILESWWEKDSMTHYRFARLNLVDLAGSERQKSSGAEGERLKEAASINKSLSTLGLVIMSLVDLAHGKHRHVPYRDSRLTFLLQDSLGGNSKTTIIANISPSTCSALETLSTLKFAQRAKLIQNNATVNEDASGDVSTLQRQIQHLKDQLSLLMKHHNLSPARFRNFYEQGERETLLAEISELREQVLDTHGTKSSENQDNDILKELEDCRNLNSKLLREIEELRGELKKYSTCTQAAVTNSYCKDDEELRHTNKYFPVETTSTESDSITEMASYDQKDDTDLKIKNNQKTSIALVNEPSNPQKELADARLLIEAMESEQARLVDELQLIQEQNRQYMEILNKSVVERVGNGCLELQNLEKQNKGPMMEGIEAIGSRALHTKLEKLTEDLEKAKLLNCRYQEDQASQFFHQNQVESIREQVEMETARTILYLQEEVCALQLELNEKLCFMTQENVRLKEVLEAKEEQIKALCGDWEKATFELTSFLLEGSKSLEDASGQIQSIVSSFPQVSVLVRENLERAAQACIDKEEAISQLEESLEDAQKMVTEMELMLYTLKEATIALNEYPQSDNHKASPSNDFERGSQVSKPVSASKSENHKILQIQTPENALTMEGAEAQLDLENTINAFYVDVEMHIASLQTDITEASTTYMKWFRDLVNEIREMRSMLMELKEDDRGFQFATVKSQASKPLPFHLFEDQLNILNPLREELAKMNERLKIIEDSINKKISPHGYLLTDESLTEVDSWSADNSLSGYSSSGSEFLSESAISGNQLDRFSYACCSKSSAENTELVVNLAFQNDSPVEAKPENSMKPMKNLHQNEATAFCLRKELDMTFHSFKKLHAHFTTIFDGNDILDISYPGEMNRTIQSFGSRMKVAEVSGHNIRKADDKVNQASSFLGKFDEARAVMIEADQMLNAMLKENEKVRQLNDMWKQSNEKVKTERSFLLEENEQLKGLISSKEKENELLVEEMYQGLVEVAKSMSLFEGCFTQMQREVDDRYKEFYSNLLFMGKELLEFVFNSRSSLEDIFSEMMQKDFAHFIFHECVVREVTQKIPSLNVQHAVFPFQQHKYLMNSVQKVRSSGEDDIPNTSQRLVEGEELITELEEGGVSLSYENMIYENLSLKKELERKEVLLKGLLFDLSLLQEAASDRKEIKDASENLILSLSEVRQELEMKTSQLDNLLVQYKRVEGHLEDTENALSMSLSDITQAKERIDTLADQNDELRMLLKDLYLKKSEAEEQLEEQKEVVRGLEKEVIHLTTSIESKVRSSVEGLEEELKATIDEKDQLRGEICSLNEKLEMAYALADENEAIAVESREEAEASKLYVEQKEEEVKILENSIEELECTINVLEKKVYEMNDEVERHRLIRESLEVELQALRQRLLTVENFSDAVDSGNISSVIKEDPMSRYLHSKLLELHDQIQHLERDIAAKDGEIKQCKDYISELVLHSEAQASQFQDKYKTLEAMFHEVRTNMSSSSFATATVDRSDKSSVRTRGSSSPFRCISSLVQQMNLEKDQELSAARLRIEELQTVLASRQKEVCMLNARLAAAESMTHDVIRDLLGVKFDMTNYADLIDQHQVQKLVEAAQQQTEEFQLKEQEISNLRREIDYLIEERESCICEINEKATELLAAQMDIEQLEERDQMLAAQNEMLKKDKSNLIRRVAELDEMIKTLLKTGSTQASHIQKMSKSKVDTNLTEKVARSENLLFRVNKELAQYRNHPNAKINGNGIEMKNRRQNP